MTVERVSTTPSMVRSYLQRAVEAMRSGDFAHGRQVVETVLTGLQQQAASENLVLDTWSVTPEAPAAREVPPLYPGVER